MQIKITITYPVRINFSTIFSIKVEMKFKNNIVLNDFDKPISEVLFFQTKYGK